MVSLFPKRSVLIFLMIVAGLGFASCTSGKPMWSLVKLVTVGDPIKNSVQETVEVKNCGEPIEKTTTCSAGTSDDLNVNLTTGGAFGKGSQFIIEGGVGTTLGIGQESGESIRLPIPPDGFIYTYTVSKSYQIVSGQALARSSSGDEKVVNFDFHAGCSIDIVNKEQSSCSANELSPNNQTQNATSANPTAAPTSIDVSVSATKGWQNTQVSVQAGTVVTMEVIDGQWTCVKGKNPYTIGGGYGWTCGPDEATAKKNGCVEPLPSFPTCGLIGKVGKQIFGVGIGTTISIEENGVLYLRMNDPDDGLYNNDGALTVRISASN